MVQADVTTTLKSMLVNDLGLDLDAGAFDERTPLFEDGLDLDSIVIVELIAEIEQRFNFQFHDEDLRMASFENIESLAKVIVARSP